MYATISKSDIMAYVNNTFTFFKSSYYIQFLFKTGCLSTIFHLDCTRLCRFKFLTHVGKNSQAVEVEIKWATWLYHQNNQSIHVTDGITVTSLSTNFLQKVSAATDHLCQIAINRILLHKFEKWRTSSSHVKVKLCKKNSHKMRHVCTIRSLWTTCWNH